MIGVIQFTISKLKEPSFLVILIIFAFIGSKFTTSTTLAENISSDIMGDVIKAGQGEPILSGSIFAVLIALLLTVFVGGSEIPRDINSRTVMLILSKPIKKETYLIGKFIGVLAMGIIFYLSFEIPMIVFSFLDNETSVSFSLILRQLSLIVIFVPVAALTVSISCFTTEISSMILTICYLLFGLSVAMTPILLAALPEGMTGVNFFVNALYYIFPNFIYFLKDMSTLSFNYLVLVIYSFSIAAIFINVAAIRMNMRDINAE